MPKRYKFSPSALAASAKRAGARHGARAALILAGAGITAATVNRPVEVREATLVEQLALRAPDNVVPAITQPGPSVAPANKLDNGMNHSRIDAWVKRFASSEASFRASMNRMSKYAHMITSKLEAKDMPKDLVYLAMIESNFDPTARSPVGARGMWQFMSPTARQFGLTVRGKVDERKNPVRSTDAALAYLDQLYNRFGSWYLAAAAYNSGQGTVSRALKRVTGKARGTDADFFRIAKVLPKETQDYVPKLIAASRVGNNPEKYGVELSSRQAE